MAYQHIMDYTVPGRFEVSDRKVGQRMEYL